MIQSTAVTKRRVVCFALVLAILPGAFTAAEAGTVITGLTLTVAGNNSVTVHNTGSSAYPGGVGTAGNYPFINGWGWSSGSIEWRDTNNTLTLRLDSSGIDVLNGGGIANSNGSKSGSVQLTGNSTLGTSLRNAHGVGVSTFTSTISQGSVDFNVTGTVTVEPSTPLITGLSVNVAANNSVTVNNTGTSNYFGNVGTAGTYGYMNGWSHVSGTITWKDTNNNTAATLGSSGVFVPVTGRIANSNGSKSGSVQLAGNTTLGAALRSAYGVGTNPFASVIAEGSRDYAVSGTVTVAPLAPDLIVEFPAVSDSTLMEGQTFTVSATVRNNGLGSAPSTTLRYLRHNAPTICPTCLAVIIGSDPVDPLGPGSTSAESEAVLAPGTNTGVPYWIIACVEAVPGESSTSNQCSAGVPITMTCDALTVGNQTVSTMQAFHACKQLTAGPSLTVTTGLGATLAGGESVRVVDGFEVATNAKLTVKTCGQNLCQTSPSPLDASCHPCVQSICAVDPWCCNTSWDGICTGEVGSVCGLACP